MTLREWRISMGFTQQQAADHLGLAVEYYKPIEYEKAPMPHWIKRKIDDTKTT
jgi:transcriptional regulator with XRE-family HTH domain